MLTALKIRIVIANQGTLEMGNNAVLKVSSLHKLLSKILIVSCYPEYRYGESGDISWCNCALNFVATVAAMSHS